MNLHAGGSMAYSQGERHVYRFRRRQVVECAVAGRISSEHKQSTANGMDYSQEVKFDLLVAFSEMQPKRDGPTSLARPDADPALFLLWSRKGTLLAAFAH